MATKRSARVGGALAEAASALGRALVQGSLHGMIIGGIAVIARGVPRATRDVDATIDGTGVDLQDLLVALAGHDLVPRISDAAEFATHHQVLLLRHEPSGVDVDLTIAWLPFELDAIAAAETLTLGTARVPVARAEDLVIYKAVAWRPQDQQDVERLLTLHGDRMDLDRVRRTVAEFAAALDDPQRVDDFERLLARATKG